MNLPSAYCALSHSKEDGPRVQVPRMPRSYRSQDHTLLNFEALPPWCDQIGCVPVKEGQGEQRQGEPGLCKR